MTVVETSGHFRSGDMLIIDSTHQGTIRVMDEFNYNLYKRGLGYEFLGGFTCFFPATVTVPRAGRWHAMVAYEGDPPGLDYRFKVRRAAGLQSA
ncbi:hypothetical protein CCR85_00020 [Rhodothalassium salexigens]|uniref:DUF1883 domain-containing protein n=1 Tax=Rhodothalassium salexigens TaxID=1086 RepID=UPI00191167FB|nr:DUF1883 domain-containing protein [Rhodothalassium salexigens]MBK5909879.1 hypothetical protein [Rhodothalassium salexigens]